MLLPKLLGPIPGFIHITTTTTYPAFAKCPNSGFIPQEG